VTYIRSIDRLKLAGGGAFTSAYVMEARTGVSDGATWIGCVAGTGAYVVPEAGTSEAVTV
jgi:hypothetical protein